MKRYTLAALCLLLCLVQVQAQSLEGSRKEFVGEGRALLGSGATLAQTEEIAFRLAQRDAIERSGVKVISSFDLSKAQLNDRVNTSARQDITTIAAGQTKLIPGTKQVQRELDGQYIWVVVRAVFQINESDLSQALRSFESNPDRFRGALDRARALEDQLDAYAAGKLRSDPSIDVAQLVTSYSNAQDQLGRTLLLDGQGLFSEAKQMRLEKIASIYSYVLYAIDATRPSRLFDAKIDPPRSSQDQSGRGLTMDFTVHVGVLRDAVRSARSRRRCVDDEIWSGNRCGGPHCLSPLAEEMYGIYIGNGHTGEPVTRLEAALAFLNANGNVIALSSGSAIGINFRILSLGQNNIFINGNGSTVTKKLTEFLPDDLASDVTQVSLAFFEQDDFHDIVRRNYAFAGIPYGVYYDRASYLTLDDISLTDANYLRKMHEIFRAGLKNVGVTEDDIRPYMVDECKP